jgi:ABC-type methionine transport system ATPase subunit
MQSVESVAVRPGGTPTLATRRLCRSVGGELLVDDITVQVETGEVLAVVGPSGAGKSSFLRLLNRLDEPKPAVQCCLTVKTIGQSRRESCADVSAW